MWVVWKSSGSADDVVIVNGFIRVSSFKGSIDMTEGEINLLKHFSAMEKPFAATAPTASR